ncbi:MAG: hypothetical protein KKG04_02660 [Candidatus Thermoplasmatota archaeon]|nr:hypothetical protein [Candidatus Thermoplasmatota archaeon]
MPFIKSGYEEVDKKIDALRTSRENEKQKLDTNSQQYLSQDYKDTKRIKLLENIAIITLYLSFIVGFFLIFGGFYTGSIFLFGYCLILVPTGIIIYAVLGVLITIAENVIAIRRKI